jgi:hypothetical protein
VSDPSSGNSAKADEVVAKYAGDRDRHGGAL